MAAYALQTKSALQSVSKFPSQILGAAPKRDLDTKNRLPTKRRRELICQLGSFKDVFHIKPCPESPFDEPEGFKPIRVIRRAQLPFTFLEPAQNQPHTSNRLFSAFIDILEDQDTGGCRSNASDNVLIARHEAHKTLYAIERVQPRVYTVCKLAWWLKEKDVEDLWDPAALELYPSCYGGKENMTDDTQWWQQAAVHVEPQRQTRSIRISMWRPQPQAQDSQLETREREQSLAPGGPETTSDVVPGTTGISFVPPSPQQLLDTLVQQYLDAVYMSKMSLAYFAKGPIARVRNAFTSAEEGAPPTQELVDFLKSMILSHRASEKKYSEKLPEVVKSIPPGSYSDDEAAAGSKPKKSKKKVKLSRSGMYPHEEDIVKRWWNSELTSQELHGEETLDQRIKRRIGDLRVREALAQMILMLEIIALEALSSAKGSANVKIVAPAESETQGESQADAPKKGKKKLEDTKLLLDLLLDKLCIWQSVDQAGILDFGADPGENGDAMDDAGKPNGNDRLQGFCVEVIIPFYMSRLPEQARAINKKLGGPVHTSPAKRKAARPPPRQQGESREPDLKKSRRSLARVATDTAAQSVRRSATPSLHRSTTDSTLFRGIKRETSEVPLAAIPFQRSPSAASRQSMSNLKHLTGRQINLSAPSAAAEAKLRQKKRVEDELKEAIATLKKPNRGLAAGSYVEDMERRGLGSASKSRKPATTVRKVMKDVQVSATPRVTKRTKDMVQSTPRHHHDPFVRDDAPPSSSFCIPSSAVRSVVPGTVQRSVLQRNTAPPAVAETPSRPPPRKTFDSPGQCRRAIFATPAKRRGASPPAERMRERETSPTAVFATPVKGNSSSHVGVHPFKAAAPRTPMKADGPEITETPLRASTPPAKIPEPEPSIYDALGWNDDDDFL